MIIRTNKDHNPFVMLDKTALNDDRLSWKAKGLHAFMMSKPDHWRFYMDNLEKASKDGRESLRSAFKELQAHGYIDRKPHQDSQGKLDGWETIVNEKPLNSNRQAEKPTDGKAVGRENRQTGKPSDVKPATSNNDFSNNDSSNNDSSNKPIVQQVERFEEWWNLYNHKIGRKNCISKYEKAVKDYGEEKVFEGTKAYLAYWEAVNAIPKRSLEKKHPSTFLNGEHFNDEYDGLILPKGANSNGPAGKNEAAFARTVGTDGKPVEYRFPN